MVKTISQWKVAKSALNTSFTYMALKEFGTEEGEWNEIFRNCMIISLVRRDNEENANLRGIH